MWGSWWTPGSREKVRGGRAEGCDLVRGYGDGIPGSWKEILGGHPGILGGDFGKGFPGSWEEIHGVDLGIVGGYPGEDPGILGGDPGVDPGILGMHHGESWEGVQGEAPSIMVRYPGISGGNGILGEDLAIMWRGSRDVLGEDPGVLGRDTVKGHGTPRPTWRRRPSP